MTVFYCLPSNRGFGSEFVKDGISISVIGDYYAPTPEDAPEDFIPEYKGYLVNTSSEVEEWSDYICQPTSPLRIFG